MNVYHMMMDCRGKMGVRLVTVNDGVDSFNGDDDFTPFRNIMNEWYARDTSRKSSPLSKPKGRQESTLQAPHPTAI